MNPVSWSDLARRDLRRIRAFLEPIDPDLAADVLLAIESAAHRLVDHPLIGPPLGIGKRRKLSVTDYHYVVIYRLGRGGPIISRVHHANENWRVG